MTIFIDFDDVIFNTQQFKNDLKDVFVMHNVSNEDYIKTYFPEDNATPKTYDPRAQIERICADREELRQPLLVAVEDFLAKECGHYVFSDVADFVKSIGDNDLVVVSFGERRMQEEKIQRSGIQKYLSHILITENKKSQAIKKYALENGINLDNHVYFIDDRIEQISDVKTTFPEIKTIFVKRPEGRYQEQQRDTHCDYEVHSLLEVAEIINAVK